MKIDEFPCTISIYARMLIMPEGDAVAYLDAWKKALIESARAALTPLEIELGEALDACIRLGYCEDAKCLTCRNADKALAHYREAGGE
jgi:hypothetical protein